MNTNKILAVIATILALTSAASAQVVLPDTGIVAGDYVGALVTLIAAAAAAALGGMFALYAVKRTSAWVTQLVK